jgi:hypothetical protein
MADILSDIKETKKRNAARRSTSKKSKGKRNREDDISGSEMDEDGPMLSLRTMDNGNTTLKITLGR